MRFIRLVPLGLPLSAIVNMLVKEPIGQGVGELSGIDPVLGYLAAAGAHALLNSGAVLYQLGLAPGWAANAGLGAMLIAFALLFERIRPKRAAAGRAEDTVHCPAGE
jgi:hypothetical protein